MTESETFAERLARSSGTPEQWRAVAPGWGRQRAYVWEFSQHVGQALVDAVDPQPGETLLELAAGPGDTGFEAAARLGAGGRLISTDVAPEMVAIARERGRELGLANVEYRVVDAQAIDLPDGGVDGVLCRWGYMLVPDPARALTETHRVLRAGGRVAFVVWAEAAANPWGAAVGRALLSLGLIEHPDPDAPGPFRLGDPERLRGLVRDAGFGEPALEEIPVTWRHASLDEYWAVTSDLSFFTATALETFDEDVLREMRARVAESLAGFTRADGSLAGPGLCRLVLARKAGTV